MGGQGERPQGGFHDPRTNGHFIVQLGNPHTFAAVILRHSCTTKLNTSASIQSVQNMIRVRVFVLLSTGAAGRASPGSPSASCPCPALRGRGGGGGGDGSGVLQ